MILGAVVSSGGGGAPINLAYVTIGNDGALTAERALTGTANQITITDNGANSTVVLSAPQDIHTGSSPTFAGLTLTGDITATIAGGLNVNLGILAGDDFTIDTSAFAVEGDTGNVGIGTASPAAKFDINPTQTSGTIATIDYNAASATTAALTGLAINLSTNVTPGAIEHSGLKITIPATTRANTAGEGALAITSNATAARSLNMSIKNSSGTVAAIYYPSATTWTGAVTMLLLNGATNVTPGAQAF